MKRWIDKNYKIVFPKARGEIKDVGYPAYADTKYDGELNFVIVRNGVIEEMVNKDKYGTHRTDFYALEEIKKLGIKGNVIICGELYIGKNVYDFLRNRDNDELKFAMFDLWEFNEVGTRQFYCKDTTPFDQRKQKIEQIFKGKQNQYIHYATGQIVNNEAQLQQAKQTAITQGREGIIAKALKSVWRGGDIKTWTKLKQQLTADLIVLGYSRKAKYLSLLLGYKDPTNGKFVSLCGCGSGLTYSEKLRLKALLETQKLPDNQQFDKKNVLVTPQHVVEVEYQEEVFVGGVRTALRHPVFKRIRGDKTISDVSYK